MYLAINNVFVSLSQVTRRLSLPSCSHFDTMRLRALAENFLGFLYHADTPLTALNNVQFDGLNLGHFLIFSSKS